jgi:8-oxo-dGTP pyrophosphatase MutT (NUDIX family)
MNNELPQWLATRLAEPGDCPNFRGHCGEAVVGENATVPFTTSQKAPRPAAVLLLLYPHESQWHLPLTLRPAHLPDHPGQVSLPGGAVEPGETTAQTAIREFHEELGDDGQPIDLLGALSPHYVRVSNFLVAPWVAAATARPRFVANPVEVEEILEVPLAHLLDPAHFGSHTREREGRTYSAPHFLFESHRVWGATYAILGEFAAVLSKAPNDILVASS